MQYDPANRNEYYEFGIRNGLFLPSLRSGYVTIEYITKVREG